MGRYTKIVLIFTILGAIGFGFLNCSGESDASLFNHIRPEASCFSSEDSDEMGEGCFSSNSENLSINTSVSIIEIRELQTFFNLGGECNDGGYFDNRIDWQIQDEATGQVVASSTGGLDKICTNPSSVSNISEDRSGICVDGRYNMLIALPAGYEGLRTTGGALKEFDLKLCISGVNNGEFFSSGSVKHIDLHPINEAIEPL